MSLCPPAFYIHTDAIGGTPPSSESDGEGGRQEKSTKDKKKHAKVNHPKAKHQHHHPKHEPQHEADGAAPAIETADEDVEETPEEDVGVGIGGQAESGGQTLEAEAPTAVDSLAALGLGGGPNPPPGGTVQLDSAAGDGDA